MDRRNITNRSDGSSHSSYTHDKHDSNHGVSKRGYLKKKSFWSKWKDAWFVLESSFLMEFKSDTSTKPSKVISIQNYHLQLAENITGAKYSFGLLSSTSKDPIFFLAATEADMIAWVTPLMKVCKSHEVDWHSEDQKMLDAFNDAVVMSSETGVIIGSNAAALELFGYTKNEFIGKSLNIIMPPEIAARHGDYMSNYMTTGIKRLIGKPRELPSVKADGTPIKIVLSLGEIVENEGKTIKFIGTIRMADNSNRSEFSQDSLQEVIYEKIDDVFDKASKDLKETLGKKVLKEVFSNLEDLRNKTAELSLEMNRQHKQKKQHNRKSGKQKVSQDFLSLDTSSIVIGEKLTDNIGGSGASIYSCYVDGWVCAMKEFTLDNMVPTMIDSVETEVLLLESLPIHKNLVRYLFHRRIDGSSPNSTSSTDLLNNSNNNSNEDYYEGAALSPSLTSGSSYTSLGRSPRIQLFMTRYPTHLTSVIRIRRKENKFFTSEELVRYSLDIVRGIEVLHQHNIIHRDLKSDNIFVVLNSNGEIHNLVIADFDTAKLVSNFTMAKTTLGTPGFIAPEVLKSRSKNPYSFAVDIWSFGMVLFEMMSLKRPFEEKSMFDVVNLTENGYFPTLSSEVEERYTRLIPIWKKCLSQDPSQRPTSTELKLMIAHLV